MSNSEPEARLEAAIIEIYHRIKAEAEFETSYYFDLLSSKDGLQTAKILFATEEPTDGLKTIAQVTG